MPSPPSCTPLTKMVLGTNIYLRLPVSSYDGRRFLVLLEPMLAPSLTNARIYSSDYIVVASPADEPLGAVHMDDIRHIYLHYEIEPLVYARAQAMERLQPLLRAVQDAPLEYTYKTEIVPLITECLIKAIETHTMDVGLAKPQRPTAVKQRADLERYDAEMSDYDRQAEAVRRRAVDLAMRQGWVLVDYFYAQIGAMEKDGISLKENMGQMVYGMDVDRERHKDQQIAFLPQGSHDVLRRATTQLTRLQLAEMKIYKGDLTGASDIANKSPSPTRTATTPRPTTSSPESTSWSDNPVRRSATSRSVLDTSKDPRTLAWSHIYLGRLYDIMPDREKAVAEYQAALVVRDAQPDTRAAAEEGIKRPFVAPQVEHQAPDDADDSHFDPSGKAEKDAYRPPPPH